MARAARGVYVSRIKYRIRNQHADIAFPRLAILLGPNGSGKTSAINAIQLGLMGSATEVGLWPSVKQPARLQSLLNNGQPGTVSAVVGLSDGRASQWGMTVTPGEGGKLKAKVQKPESPVSDDTFIVQWLEGVLAKESAMAVLLPRMVSRLPEPEWLQGEVASAQAEGAPDMESMSTLAKLYALRDRLNQKLTAGVAVAQETAQEQLKRDTALTPLPVAPVPGASLVPGAFLPVGPPAIDPWQPLRVFLMTGAAGPEVPADITQYIRGTYDGFYQRIGELERQANQRDWLGAKILALNEGHPLDREWAPPLPPEIAQAIRAIAEKLIAYQQISAAYPALWAAFQAVDEYQKWLAQAVAYNEAYFPIQQAFNQILAGARAKAGFRE